MVPPDSTNFISDAISGYSSKKYQNGHLCISGLKLLATTVSGPLSAQDLSTICQWESAGAALRGSLLVCVGPELA